MWFSLLIPTRDRPELRYRQLLSLRETTNDLSELEILYAIDDDDTQTKENLNYLKTQFPEINIQYFERNRSCFFQRDYYNWLTTFATGDFCWLFGDDVIFLCKDWDVIVKEKINTFLQDKPDRIICVSLKDNTPKPSNNCPPFPCFPLISKEAIKVLGFISPLNVPTWGADHLIYYIYQPLGRLLTIDDRIYLQHVSYHAGTVLPDKIAIRVGKIFRELQARPEYNTDRILREEIPIYRNYLQCIIQGRFNYD